MFVRSERDGEDVLLRASGPLEEELPRTFGIFGKPGINERPIDLRNRFPKRDIAY